MAQLPASVKTAPPIIPLQPKHRIAVLDYPISFAERLFGNDTLAGTVSVTSTPAGLVIVSNPAPVVIGNVVAFWLSGGAAGVQYQIQVVAPSKNGRNLVANLQILVFDPIP